VFFILWTTICDRRLTYARFLWRGNRISRILYHVNFCDRSKIFQTKTFWVLRRRIWSREGVTSTPLPSFVGENSPQIQVFPKLLGSGGSSHQRRRKIVFVSPKNSLKDQSVTSFTLPSLVGKITPTLLIFFFFV